MIAALKLDTLFGFLAALIYFIIVLIAQVNPPAIPDIKQPGNIVVSIAWAQGRDDVDLWLASPSDAGVGYSNKSGRVWSLLRDDLGMVGDDTPLNYESAYSRGVPDGGYTVNVKCFRCAGPTPVHVEVRLATGALVWSGVVNLAGSKDERTAIRWRMRDGAVVRGSHNFVFKEISK